MDYFNLREKGVYWSLCQVFGEDAQEEMPVNYMFMMAQIIHPYLVVTFYFFPFLVDLIHEGLIGIQRAKVDRLFC